MTLTDESKRELETKTTFSPRKKHFDNLFSKATSERKKMPKSYMHTIRGYKTGKYYGGTEVDQNVMTTRSGLSIRKISAASKTGAPTRNPVQVPKEEKEKPVTGYKRKHSIVKYKSMSYMSFVTRFYLCLRVPELDLAGVNPRETLQYLEDCPMSSYDENSSDDSEDEEDDESNGDEKEHIENFTLSVAEDVNNNERGEACESQRSAGSSTSSKTSDVTSKNAGDFEHDDTSSVWSESGSECTWSDDVFHHDSDDSISNTSDFSPRRHQSDSAYESARLRLSDLQLKLVQADGGKLLKCQDCDKVFTILSAFTAHLKTHVQSKNRCDVCGKVFTRSWLLKGHRRTHTGERPFPCPHKGCEKAFADKSNLRSHLMIHTTTNKNFTCQRCGRAFAQKRYLHKHMLEVCRLI